MVDISNALQNTGTYHFWAKDGDSVIGWYASTTISNYPCSRHYSIKFAPSIQAKRSGRCIITPTFTVDGWAWERRLQGWRTSGRLFAYHKQRDEPRNTRWPCVVQSVGVCKEWLASTHWRYTSEAFLPPWLRVVNWPRLSIIGKTCGHPYRLPEWYVGRSTCWSSRHRPYERVSSQLTLVAKCRFGNRTDCEEL